MKKRKIAVIDLGTNTFHLLIAEVNEDGTYQLLLRNRQAVMIGRGGITRGLITKDAQQRALSALSSFRTQIDQFGVKEVYATATSAFRSAGNKDSLVQRIAQQTGIHINVIDGSMEAELIFLGVKEALQMRSDKVVIMDIGGGSVEFIICDREQVIWKESFEIGAQRLLDLFVIEDPITHQNITTLEDYFKQELPALFEAAERLRPATLIGASGTFDTLSDIYMARQKMDTSSVGAELPLDYESFLHTHQLLTQKNRAERMQIPGMIEMRVDMIVVASCLIDFIMKKLSITNIRVSAYALKEGLLRQVIDGQAPK